MNECLDFYKKQVKAGFSTIPWVAEIQAKGLRQLAYYGFPSKQDEEWKYTAVDKLLQQRFSPIKAESYSKQQIPNLVLEADININNGEVILSPSAKYLPKSAFILPLEQVMDDHAELIKPYLDTILLSTHGFHALNTAFLQSGVVIYLPENSCIEEPIVLSHWQDQSNQAVYTRHLIIAGAHSKATIVEDYQGEEGCSYFNNTVTEVFLGAYAELTHYKIQRESKQAYHIGHLAVKQSAASQFNSHSVSVGGKLVRSDSSFFLTEEQASCLLNGIYAPANGQHIDHHTVVNHLVPNCSSEQDYKGILNAASRAVFNGKVVVAKDAQRSQAQQQNKNLLLSSKAEINTKPQLDIFADDVICTHGATVGQLDEEAIFYLATRGLAKEDAVRYLIQAFTADNLRLIPHQGLAEWIGKLVTQQLGEYDDHSYNS